MLELENFSCSFVFFVVFLLITNITSQFSYLLPLTPYLFF